MEGIRYSDGVLATVARWLYEKQVEAKFAYNLKGGWEGWAQVELAWALTQDHGYNFSPTECNEVTRENHTYTDAGREDAFLIRSLAGPSYIIELKCESSGNVGKFVDGVSKDLKKVDKGIAQKYCPATVWVIGICPAGSPNEAKVVAAGLKKYEPERGSDDSPFRVYFKKLEFK